MSERQIKTSDEDLIFPLPFWFIALTLIRYSFARIARTFFRKGSAPISDKPLCIGHRGCRGKFPENSFASFNYARDHADGFELDTQLTKDFYPVVIHDSTVDRTSNGSGRIDEKNLEDLKNLSLENGETIPGLDEILRKFGNHLLINVEIKKEITVERSKQSAKVIGELIKNSGIDPSNAIVSSFSPIILYYIKKYYPTIHRAQLIADPKKSHIPGFTGWILGSPIFAIAWSAKTLVWEKSIPLKKPNSVRKMHKFKKTVWVYTSNDPKEWEDLGNMNIDGIITDEPEELKKFLLTLH